MVNKIWCKNHVKRKWNKNLTDKNKAYRKNMQLPTYIPLGRYAPSKNRMRKKINKQVRTTHTKIQKHDSKIMILIMNHYLWNGRSRD